MHLPKKGLRALGIAESFSGRTCSTLAGVVMRKDLLIDGFTFGRIMVGGMDATDTILGMVRDRDRLDINVIMLSGCVIAWFNILDPARIFRETDVPVICISYEESEGLVADIRHHFPGDEKRVTAYCYLGERIPVILPSNLTIFIRAWGLNETDAAQLCNNFTLGGKIPEPLRVAWLCSRALIHSKPGWSLPLPDTMDCPEERIHKY
ncbi:MAG: DUF99 family protein [Methanomicrobiales archaeon]